MNKKKVGITSRFSADYWKNLILFAVFCFFFTYLIVLFRNSSVGDDYLGYWSVGKIADQKGFSEIYNLENLRLTQLTALDGLGYGIADDITYLPMPVPYLSFFLLPLKYLSRIGLVSSYQIWTFLNLVILIGYLAFFIRKTKIRGNSKIFNLKLIILMLISWPVLFNIICGQVEVFLLVCAGEFIRYSVAKKPLLSGIWLGGMLLKPQLLILVIPLFLIKRSWKMLGGLFVASGLILMASFSLSGFSGFNALLNLWIKQSDGMLLSAPRIMMNWRMVGANINALMNITFGWVVTGLGVILTILAVYILIKKNPSFGSPAWVMTMLGFFSATLAITWHSHSHMAMILIPFLIYASIYKLLPEKIIFLWGTMSQVTYIGLFIINLLVFVLMKIDNTDYTPIVIAFSALITNLIILISTLKIKESQLETLVQCTE